MKIINKYKSLFFLGILTLIYSCNKKKESDFPKLIHNDLEYILNLPDTVILNKPYKITIDFKSDFDKIIPPIQVHEALLDTTKTRIVVFYRYFPTNSINNIRNSSTFIDSIPVLNKTFEVENVIFKEKGKQFYYGVISDVIMYNHYNEKGIRDSVSFDEIKQEIFKKVIVIE